MTYLLFSACVALATYMQNLTGFAFSLILLGLVGSLQLAPIADAANAATVLTLVNAAVYFNRQPLTAQWRVMLPAMPSSLFGVLLGVWLLHWLSSNAVEGLRALLGVSIIACALLLMRPAPPLAALSGPRAFAFVGALSGVLGGLFSSAGPPLVYHMYRQPLERQVVQHCLLLMFACNALLRLLLVAGGGEFSVQALRLTACAVPVVYLVNQLQHRFPSKLDRRATQYVVAALLLGSGTMLLGSSLKFW